MTMKYGAITLDTSIFDRYGIRLTSNPLKSLEQFKGKPAGLVVSEVVYQEVLSHLKREIEDAKQKVGKGLREAPRLQLDGTVIESALTELDAIDPEVLARYQLAEFKSATGLEEVPAERYVRVGDLLTKYFASLPPFAKAGQKKSEFPDAICLMSLEAYAKEKNFRIVAVSADKDWAGFAKNSEWIDVEEDISKAIALFQPQKVAYDLCADLEENWDELKYRNFQGELAALIENRVAEMDVEVDADSYLHWELSSMEIHLESYELATTSRGPSIRPIRIHSSEATFAAKINVDCVADVEFSFSAYDSIDKDYTVLGGCSDSSNFTFRAEIFVTVSGSLDGDPEELDIDNLDMAFPRVRVRFSGIEPNWHNDDYDNDDSEIGDD
ncbi:hypothetical protein E4417_13055 [Stenotrophomonas maltophilia]|uniref:PIN domain-containing protein n=1 Tax=Stenotrophomonas maltophilia TaxID=40324 RepID=UPI001094C12A|nr:PIN domain-containing protein [Stenotrophomonas maltophilia]TGW17580.1 hypothetical protein E4417_13055 [Stenotrophomonas maltophilia]